MSLIRLIIKMLNKALKITIFLLFVSCVYHVVTDEKVHIEAIPEGIIQSFVEVSKVSLQKIHKTERRIFRGKIVQYLFTYEHNNGKIYIMSISPEGQLISDKNIEEWYRHQVKD
ncbi:MAG: hypothetical protein GY795_10135 [Desulfobacterales bacterium]|nr:hypothetical protein [Desulfobacterales bacterium]